MARTDPPNRNRGEIAAIVIFAWLLSPVPLIAQLRIVDYNTGGEARPSLSTVLAAIGAESVNGIAKKPDVFSLQEQETSATTTQGIVDVLNGIYGAGIYARATIDGASSGGGRPGLIYNVQTVQLGGQMAASTISASGAARETQRYEMRPVGYDEAAKFYVYVSHYKASNTAPDAARRNVEAQEVRANADALGTAHRIYAGDFNIYTSSEPMYQTLTAVGPAQAFDPLNRPGAWQDDASFKDLHTQSPAATSRYAGQVTGGMDDRFDFQLVSAELLDNEGLSYIGGSYHAFGNTGTHNLNGDITTGSATVLQSRLPGYTTAQAAAVLEALASTTDHLPVVADYQVPAKMGVQLEIVPGRIIRGANAGVDVTVTNTASAVVVAGADELDYAVSVSGSLTGGTTSSDPALGSGNTHSIALQANMVGANSGLLEVHSSSQGAANKDFTQSVTYSVLDHAKPLFVGNGEALTLTLNFETVDPGTNSNPQSFSIGNWISNLGITAGLDLDLSHSPSVLSRISPLAASETSPLSLLRPNPAALLRFMTFCSLMRIFRVRVICGPLD